MDFATTRAVEFAKENSLPGTEENGALFDEDKAGTADHSGHGMGRGVTLQVLIMTMGWHHFPENLDKIFLNGRVGSFVDGHGGGGVRVVEVADP